MHELIHATDGWILEVLRDDRTNRLPSPDLVERLLLLPSQFYSASREVASFIVDGIDVNGYHWGISPLDELLRLPHRGYVAVREMLFPRTSERRVSSEELLSGCTLLKESKRDQNRVAEVRYQELLHDRLVTVEAIVLISKEGDDEISEREVECFRKKIFTGHDCKAEAASYGLHQKGIIDGKYFRT